MQIKVSLGSANALGLVNKRVDAEVSTAHLMIGEGCRHGCAFCAQGRRSSSRADRLSRITWPSFSIDDVMERLMEAYDHGAIQRACLQVVNGGGYERVIERFFYLLNRSDCSIPVSVNCVVQTLNDADKLFALGAERVGLALDAANPEVFAMHKGSSPGDWVGRLELLRDLGAVYPGRISTHLIVGLGETEQDVADVVQVMTDAGVTVGLFAFTPVRGTPMENNPAPPMDVYRRVQLATYLISRGKISVEDIEFEDGRIASISAGILGPDVTRQGKPFETSGCEDCNRPYYNERPGQVPYNYPRPLRASEVKEALRCAGCIHDDLQEAAEA